MINFSNKVLYLSLFGLCLMSVSCARDSHNLAIRNPIELGVEINMDGYSIIVADRNVGAEMEGEVGWFSWTGQGANYSEKWKGDWIEWDDAIAACENFKYHKGDRGWRLPTKAELIAITGNEGNMHGVNDDRKIKAEIEDGIEVWKLYDEYTENNMDFVYFPMSGSTIDWVDYFNDGGHYWSSDLNVNNSDRAWYLFIGLYSNNPYTYSSNNGSEMFYASKNNLGLSVRCVKNI